MASAAADTAIRDYLAAHFSAVPVFFENEDMEPPASPASWVYAEIESDDDDQESLGAGEPSENLWREVGTLRLHVLVAVGSGTGDGNVTRDMLAGLFRGLQLGGLTFRTIHRSRGMRWEELGISNGNWWALPLTIDWYLDH